MADHTSSPDAEPAPPDALALTVSSFGHAVGVELGRPLNELRTALESYAASRELSFDDARKLLVALRAGERLSRRCETLAKLAAHTEPPQKKLLQLDEVVSEVLASYDGLFDQLTIPVRAFTKPMLVICNPDVLRELAQAVLEWAIDIGREIHVMARPAAERPNPAQPYFQVTVPKAPQAEGEVAAPCSAMENSLSWHLIVQLCALLDVTPVRTETDAHYRIQIPFPKAPEDPEVLAQYEDVTPAPWWD